jgi:hypothetical protein
MQWPVSGGGQQTVSRRMYGISSSSMSQYLPGSYQPNNRQPFAAWGISNITSALATVNPGLVYLKNGSNSQYGQVVLWKEDLTVNKSVLTNLVNNFYKIDPRHLRPRPRC